MVVIGDSVFSSKVDFLISSFKSTAIPPVNLNDEVRESSKCPRRLRSYLLFLALNEDSCLSWMKVVKVNLILRTRVERENLRLTHLQFSDDVYL